MKGYYRSRSSTGEFLNVYEGMRLRQRCRIAILEGGERVVTKQISLLRSLPMSDGVKFLLERKICTRVRILKLLLAVE